MAFGIGDAIALGQLGLGAYGYDAIQDSLKDVQRGTGLRLDEAQRNMRGAGEFKPFSVSTSLGGVAGNQAGGVNFNPSMVTKAYQNQLRADATSLFDSAKQGDTRFNSNFGAGNIEMGNNFAVADQFRNQSVQGTAGREQDIYSRIRSMQRPEELRQYDSMNAGLFGSGRGGMSTEAYGGSPEQFAFGKSQAEARNQASLQAMGQAQTEMMNQGNLAGQYSSAGINAGQLQNAALQAQMQNQLGYGQLGNQMFQNQFVPGQELRAYGAMGLQNSATQNAAAQNMAGLLAQMGIGRATTEVNFANAESQNLVGLLRMLGGIGGGT